MKNGEELPEQVLALILQRFLISKIKPPLKGLR
jgi:hypothetical protein